MLPKRLYNLFLGLFPLMFAIHNLEEWLVFNSNIDSLVKFGPKFISHIIEKDPVVISTIFQTALVVATIIPLIILIIFWNSVTVMNMKILLVLAFVTLINALSHIITTIALGLISPGLITGILLCMPYSIAVIHFVRKHNKFTFSFYLLLGLGSLIVYALGLGLSWLIGLLVSL